MEDYGGRYVSITPGHPNAIDDAEYDDLVARHIMFKDMSNDKYLSAAGIASDWPHGRGCYISEDEGFLIWVGEEDHLRIMAMRKGKTLNKVFDRSGFFPLFLRFSRGKCRNCPFFRAFESEMKGKTGSGSGSGAESYIENAKGLLDGPREWWLDAATSTLCLLRGKVYARQSIESLSSYPCFGVHI